MAVLQTDLGKVHYYYRRPNQGATTVLFIPAFGWDSTYYNFKHLIDLLPTVLGVLAVDTIGVGTSIEDDMVRTPTSVCCNIHDVVTQCHLQRLVIVGHSLGGDYALLYAQRYPQEVRGLLLVEPPYSAMATELRSEVQPLIAEYPQLSLLKSKMTPKMMLADLNPLNTPADRWHNAQIVFAAYGNHSILSEAQHLQTLLLALQKAEKGSLTIPVKVLVTDNRYAEYQQSPWNQLGKLEHSVGQHYLHWTNEQWVLQQLLSLV